MKIKIEVTDNLGYNLEWENAKKLKEETQYEY